MMIQAYAYVLNVLSEERSEAAPEVGLHLELGILPNQCFIGICKLLIIASKIKILLRKLDLNL